MGSCMQHIVLLGVSNNLFCDSFLREVLTGSKVLQRLQSLNN